MTAEHPTITAIKPPSRGRAAILILAVSAWVGLVTGALEVAVIAARGAIGARVTSDLLRWNRHGNWMIPASDVSIFAAVGVLLAGLALIAPRSVRRVAGPVLGVLAFGAIMLRVPSLHPAAKWVLAGGLGLQAGRLARRHPIAFSRVVAWTLPAMAIGGSILGGWEYRRVANAERDAIAALPGRQEGGTTGTNVVLIVLDTVRADHLSLHGYPRDTTPNLKRIAARGIRFDQARSAAPWTLPSHASLLTGRWPFQLSADEDHAMNRAYPTLAEVLSAKGYATAGFVANTYYCNAAYGLGRGFARYEDCYENDRVSLDEVAKSSSLGRVIHRGFEYANICLPLEANEGKEAARLNRDALAWIDANRGRPFFAFLNYLDAHDPYLLPPGEHRHFGLTPKTPEDFATLRGWHDSNKVNVTAHQVDLVRDCYDDCIAYLDGQVGLLYDELDRRGLLRDTIVVITSDHGEEIGEHKLYGHGRSLYRPELHVPLIVTGMDAPRGRIVPDPVSLRDVPATIAEWTGAGDPSPFPGGSLAGIWSGSDEARPVLSEVAHQVKTTSKNPNRPPAWRGPMASIVLGDSVYIRNADGREELYDLAADPEESRDLSRGPEAEARLGPFRAELGRVKAGDETPSRIALRREAGRSPKDSR